MKKASLLIILGILIMSVMAGTAYAAGEEKLLISTLASFGKLTESVLGGVFKSITANPDVWMKFLMFVGIYATLMLILQTKAAKQYIDRKTAGILGFVLAFGTVAVMPSEWIIAALSIWGGIIMSALIAAPAIFLISITIAVLRDRSTHMAWKVIALIIAWGLFIWIVASVTGTLLSATNVPTTPYGAINAAMYRAQTYTLVVQLVMLTGIIAIIVLIISLLLGTAGGRDLTRDFAEGVGKRFDKMPLIGNIWGKGITEDLGPAIVEAEEIEAQLKNALTQANASDAIKYNRAIFQAETSATQLINDQLHNVEYAVNELSNLNANKTEIRDAQKKLKFIQTSANIILTETEGLKNMLTPKGGAGAIDWKKITSETNAIISTATEIKKKIEEIEKTYDAAKAAYAAAHP